MLDSLTGMISGAGNFFGNIANPISALTTGINTIARSFGRDDNLIGGNRAQTTADQPQQQSAITIRQTNQAPPQENMFSGSNPYFSYAPMSNQAAMGAIGPLVQTAGRLLSGRVAKTIGGGALLTGGGALLSGNGKMKKPLIMSNANKTRVRRMLMEFGLEYTLEQLNAENAVKGRPPVSVGDIILLLSTTIRKQGYPITYAMMRNTRKTLNRLKSMKELYGEFTKTTTRRRRTMRRVGSTVTQIKN